MLLMCFYLPFQRNHLFTIIFIIYLPSHITNDANNKEHFIIIGNFFFSVLQHLNFKAY